MFVSSNTKLLSEVNQLINKISDLHLNYQRGLVSDHPKVWKTYYKAQLTLWFIKHWPDFKSCCKDLSTQYKDESFKNIANVRIFAYVSDASPYTKGQAFKEVFDNLPGALVAMGRKDVSDNLLTKFDELVKYVTDNNPNNVKEPKVPKIINIINQQNVQIEEVVNRIIKESVPKQHQHTARMLTQQSANKLQTLRDFLTTI